MIWTLHNGAFPELLGFLPGMLSEEDPRPAREQFDANYQHGGGWRPQARFELRGTDLCYPNDPPLTVLAQTRLRDETIRLYPYGYVVILQPDGSFEACRMD
jgi:hypothetical protein